MKLKNFSLEEDLTVTYTLVHVHDKNVFEQDVKLTKTGDKWVASIEFPSAYSNSPDEAVKKLGEWLYRMSEEISENYGKFGIIDLTTVRIPN